MNDNFSSTPHRRYNILTGEYVLVSPHRTKRPWQGKKESAAKKEQIKHDPDCYLCAGNTRINGEVNPNYESTYVFQNDFGALLEDSTPFTYNEGLLKAEDETGICKVICFSPNHSETLPDMEISAIENVISVWQKEYKELGANPAINHVQIFENKGAIMGCSNPHPHGQIWAQKSIPNEVIKKTEKQEEYFNAKNQSLLVDYVKQEIELNERVIFENETFVSVVPFWAVWPYEVMILPKRQIQHIGLLTDAEKKDYAEQIKVVTQKYDKLFDCSFPYSGGIHQAPTDKEYDSWHFHMSFYPPLLRSATVKKFMVGYEMFGMPQRDITAEIAAQSLREL
ncbi:UDPglucose--hexose-1-phosphate uridylyltransferase [Lutibacter oricola]|uniref:Galactose-1-phosphate uridylyltransferase n=1 Tax=Lutibacter oricola TaxID=762486 RepID=A0A1H2UCF7_9FLAO|nr:UDP-glucose--hexose-1-phosphate uridylyltransferase [Lutibacter oricola]SDW53259.1 UDPglucose--hexose-1-phosphate uridylyltransferase [Lutibacter oricola]